MNEPEKAEETTAVTQERYTPKAHDVFETKNGGETQNLRDAYQL